MTFVTSYAVLLLASVFLASGLSKAVTRDQFRATLVELGMFPKWVIPTIQLGLPVFEIVVGILLLAGWRATVPIGAVAALALLCAFTVTAVYAMRHDKGHISCSCFGTLSQSSLGSSLIIRNAILLLLAVFVVITAFFATPADQMQAWSNWLPAGLLVACTIPIYSLTAYFLGSWSDYKYSPRALGVDKTRAD